MRKEQQVTLLMATYNGEQFIRQQLDSLLEQTHVQWKLIIRDDGSIDNTISIIGEYITLHKNISLIINDTNKTGACVNFAELFSIAKNDENVDYIMFCDQDDIWKPEKIALTMAAMQQMEQINPNEPVLIYGDFELMTVEGYFMPGGFKLKHQLNINGLLSFNYVYGCTTMLNRLLMDKIVAIPHDAINHDYWVALVASIYQSKYMPEKLLKYRQHTDNASGNVAGNNSFLKRLKRNLIAPEKEINNLKIRLDMFRKFYATKRDELSTKDRKIIAEYLKAFNDSRLKVCSVMLKDKIFRKGFFQTLSSFTQVLFFYNKLKAKNNFL